MKILLETPKKKTAANKEIIEQKSHLQLFEMICIPRFIGDYTPLYKEH
jgi:hypothetical protein